MPDTGTSIVIVSLLGLNIFQLIYWSRETHRLIDKVMSKNYAEYVQSEKFKADLPQPRKIDTSEISDDDVLRELNGMQLL